MKDHSLKVLVVDDDRAARQILTRQLEHAGYEVIGCRDGVEAMQILEEEGPALLVLDYEMPEFNGAQVCELIRNSKEPEIGQTPIILLTAHSGEDHEIECLRAGADDFVIKPINIAVLRARIETHLRLHSLRRQLQAQKRELEKWRHAHELDLDHARMTQQAMLPRKTPELAGWKITAHYEPLIQVGGDIYDVRRLQNGLVLAWIADATGHGASGALLTTLTKLLFRHAMAEHSDVANIVRSVNRDLFGVFKGRSFMSTACVTFRESDGEIQYCGAGHPPLAVLRRDGGHQFLESSGPPIGLAREIEVTAYRETLSSGDAFLLHTDGLYFAKGDPRDPAQNGFAKALNGPVTDPQAYLDAFIASIRAAARDGKFTDDVTAVLALHV